MTWPILIWRNITRDTLRSVLTGSAIALAIALVCFLATMPAGMNRLVESYSRNTRIVVHNEAGLVYPLPHAYLHKVRAMPGVIAATSWTWFGGVFDEEEGVSFPNVAIDPDLVSETWPDYGIASAAVEEFQRKRDGAIVGRATLTRYHWKVGDLVSLKGTIYPVDLTFQIVGEIPSDQAPLFWFQREYLEQAMEAAGLRLDSLGTMWVRVEDATLVESVRRTIDETFRNSDAQTASETERIFFRNSFGLLKGLIFLIQLVTALVAICIVFIAANTASMTVRERMCEIAIMKAIGFRRRRLFGILVSEATLVATLGGAVGAFASLGLTQLIRSLSGGWDFALGPMSAFVITNTILIEGLFLAFFIGMLSGAVPSLSAARSSVVQTLREVF